VNQRELFYRYLAQTSGTPLALHIIKAEGATLTDTDGKRYIDLVGGISVANVGHRHPRVIEAIKEQLEDYLHIMVYGEFVESPQVQYAELLVKHLPNKLNSVYFTNSGTEATEGAMKLAKRYTGRTRILAFNKSYHGSTQGSLSLMGDETWRNAYRPLLPGIVHTDYNDPRALDEIDGDTAAVILETVQGEAGVISPSPEWIQGIRNKCTETQTLLIMDEIQSGFGRSGKLWAFEHFQVVPDILLLGKALGGGLPLGAFIADRSIMQALAHHPVLGHITTFGGHPLCCRAGKAAMEVLLNERLAEQVAEKESLFKNLLKHDKFRAIRSAGLWLAVEFDSHETVKEITGKCLANGVFTDWYLFADNCMRISPPLTISNEAIRSACEKIVSACN
jgi:acetylornithine/succinyldiaminopimelate/putrescine aminotransferase